MKYDIEHQLHPDTADLVERFAVALARKLYAAQEKYKYGNEWKNPDWELECRVSLQEHIAKGDPLDVAAYCAFMWYHNWPTDDPVQEQKMSAYFAASRALDGNDL